MSKLEIAFWFLSALGIVSALIVVLSRNPMYSILALIVVFVAISGHYVLLNAQFLAVVNMIVYAGAILVLFLFVVMLMNLNQDAEAHNPTWLRWSGALVSIAILLLLLFVFKQDPASARTQVEMLKGNVGMVEILGASLFNKYVLPFEISSVLFLSAIIGSVLIAKKK